MDFETLQRKVQDLVARGNKIKQQKAEIQGTLKAKKQELSSLIVEIEAAGYNPKTILEDYEKTKKDLENLVAQYSSEIEQAESSLAEYQRK